MSNIESLPSVESIVPPSSDDVIFGGEIIGDELMDIYNAAVVGGQDDDHTMNDIPALLAPTEMTISENNGTNKDDGFINNLYNSSSSEEASAAAGESKLVAAISSSDISSVGVRTKRKIDTDESIVTKSGSKRCVNAIKRSSTEKPKKRRSEDADSKTKLMVTASIEAAAVASVLAANKIKVAKPAVATSMTTKPAITGPTGKRAPKNLTKNVSLPTNTQSSSAAPSHNSTVTASSVKSKTTTPASSSNSILSNPPTEADFKSVAQAAVNNLIANAGNSKKLKTSYVRNIKSLTSSSSSASMSSSNGGVTQVDTSTEHVKALTGSNWVAVCGGAIGIGVDRNSMNSDNSTDKNRKSKSNLTPDERAKQNRDRNREHARNTRLRKKAYVEELKATLSALVSQRDASELERRHSAQRELEQREVRFRVLEEFLKLRGRNETNPARWAAILEEKFHLTLPVTAYRSMVRGNGANNDQNHEQVLTGVTEVMHDSALCSSFLQGLTGKSTTKAITHSYSCDRSDFLMDNCRTVLDWTANTNATTTQTNATSELFVKGQIQAEFCPASNKLTSAALKFDTGSVVSQISRLGNVIVESNAAAGVETAANVAVNEADALLDSLQMPRFDSETINYVPPSSVSSANSSDDDKEDNEDNTTL